MNLKTSQKTYVPCEKDLTKKWFLVDVKGKNLGTAATKIANLLRGKNKTFFTPQQDCGDFVIAINAKDIKLAGTKTDKKLYQWHTKYPGGFRERTAQDMLDTKPEKVLELAVSGMLPRTKTRKHLMRRLRVFVDEKYTHDAQKPQTIEL